MNQMAKKWLKFLVRWTIAVGGIAWVVSQISWRDQLTVLNEQGVPVPLTLADAAAAENAKEYHVVGRAEPVPRDQTLNRPDRKTVTLRGHENHPVKLLGYDLVGDLNTSPRVARLLVEDPDTHAPRWCAPADLAVPLDKDHPDRPRVPYPRVEVGLGRMARQASANNLGLLILAISIFPVTFIACSYRWHELLKALEIEMQTRRAFVLTMVGAFYNTFMPGSTGGDVLKAIYASRLTSHRTRAVISVLIDRIIGLLALVILGGIMAATQWHNPVCRRVAMGSGLIIGGTIAGLVVFFQPTLHRLFGLDWIIKRLPAQKQVHNAIQSLQMYRQRPLLVLWSLIVTFPVHITVVISAMLSVWAFGLPREVWYYFVIVPVIVLVGAIPISPQGAGVMEWMAIILTKPKGITVGQAFALTMSIRLVQIFWNLTGGMFVLRGGFHKPTQAEQQEVAAAEDDDASGTGTSSAPVATPNV